MHECHAPDTEAPTMAPVPTIRERRNMSHGEGRVLRRASVVRVHSEGRDPELMPTSYYDTLQVSPRAHASVIRAAYRALAQRWHPDRNEGELATSNMQRINEAYEVLSDEGRRAKYDELLRSVNAVHRAAQASPDDRTAASGQQSSASVRRPTEARCRKAHQKTGWTMSPSLQLAVSFVALSAACLLLREAGKQVAHGWIPTTASVWLLLAWVVSTAACSAGAALGWAGGASRNLRDRQHTITTLLLFTWSLAIVVAARVQEVRSRVDGGDPSWGGADFVGLSLATGIVVGGPAAVLFGLGCLFTRSRAVPWRTAAVSAMLLAGLLCLGAEGG